MARRRAAGRRAAAAAQPEPCARAWRTRMSSNALGQRWLWALAPAAVVQPTPGMDAAQTHPHRGLACVRAPAQHTQDAWQNAYGAAAHHPHEHGLSEFFLRVVSAGAQAANDARSTRVFGSSLSLFLLSAGGATPSLPSQSPIPLTPHSVRTARPDGASPPLPFLHTAAPRAPSTAALPQSSPPAARER
eukprot:43835-Chlamydomonas_euryale.AAC.3